MTTKTSHHETPDAAELRRLLDEATPRPWHAWDRGIGFEVHTEAEHNPIRCDPLNSGFRETFCGPDARLIVAAVNSLESLLDALDVAEDGDEIAGRLAHLLCDLTGGLMSKTSYPVPVMEREIEQYLSECHESDLKDERDALRRRLVAVEMLVEDALRHGYDLDPQEIASALASSLDATPGGE